jgi:hypothetical protein
MKHDPRPLSDDEIARKFEVSPGTPEFESAKALSESRPDRSICDMPYVTCPHCSEESRIDDYHDVEAGEKWLCEKCQRFMYVELVDHTVQVHLSTHPAEEVNP